MQMDAEAFYADRDALLPLLDYLTKDFGVKFDLEDMGGGCTAIQSDFADGLTIFMQDQEGGGEATAAYPGWFIGVYQRDSDDCVDVGAPLVFVSLGGHQSHEQTAALVRAALAAGKEMRTCARE